MRTSLPTVSLLAFTACQAPQLDRMFNDLQVEVSSDEATANRSFIDAITSAEQSLHIALPASDDAEVTDAILAAADRGVAVEVITDYDLRDTPTIVALLDAGVPTTLADDAVSYFDFNLNAQVDFASEQCVMSHAFVVADRARVVTGSRFGGLVSSPQVVYRIEGEEIVEDLLWEHNQVFGGVDATTVTVYDANAKSITEPRWSYMLPQPVQLGLWFGPQERLMKRVIDAVYSARSSVRVLSPTFANPELAKALQDKAQWGIPVDVVVGPDFDPNSPDVRAWYGAATDVSWHRMSEGDAPTIVLIDYELDERGLFNMPRAMVLTHGMLSGARLYRGEPTASDQLVDGTLWSLDQTITPGPELLLLSDLYDDLLADSEAL
jgi:hypothetical protein